MAGNYFHDPRPFYGLNQHNLISMDELFYGRREPPPWYMHQMPHSRFDDQPRSRSMEPHRPEQYIHREDQFREYKRPDMRDDIYMDYQYDMHGANKGQQKNHNQGGGNNNGNNNGGNNGGNNGNKGKKQQKHDNDSEEDDYEKNQKGGHHGNNNNHGNKSNNNHGNKSHNNDHGHNMGGHSNKSSSDNKGSHGGRGHVHHRRSLSLTQTVLKKLGLRDDSSSDSSDDDRHGSRKNKKGGHGHMQMKADHKPYTVRFDDQFYGTSHGYSNQSNNKKGGGSEKLGEDHGSHGNKKGGQPQGILKSNKNKHGDDGYSSDEENRVHKNHGNGKGGNQHHGGSESGKKNGQAATKQLGRSQSMDFRVNLCCDNCESKVKKALWKMDVDQVLCDQWNNKVVVMGNAKPESVLKKLRSVKKDTHVWHHQK